jgi:hypothetical protein
MKIEEQILGNLKSLINQYEAELTFLHNRSMNKFDTTQLPEVVQDMVKLATAKTPSFSNISAVAVSNFILSHMFGQLRPHINDPIYSDDTIGINTYSIIISRSGSGKDSTYQALMKAVSSAHEFIHKQQVIELEDKALAKFVRESKKAQPDFDETTVTRAHFEHLIDKPETPIASLASTRGGLTTSLNRMAKANFGVKSLFASELGLAIQSNSSIVEVLELFSTLYDMGESVAPEFKTQESKEESVNNMFPNLLGISSPAPFYTEGNVRRLLIPMMTTSLARRISIVFSNASEEFENEYIPKSPAERRELQAQARVILKESTERLNTHFLKCVKHTIADTVVMMDEEAQAIYDDYKSYTQDLSKYLLLKNGDSVEGIEMSGRAFKMGRIAATWTLAENKRIIDAKILKSAIYFCDYTAQHLIRFADTLELKDYEIFINDWEQGFIDNVLPVDQAITKGYISTKHLNKSSLENFLKPVNSKLEGKATVSYNDKINAFVFVPVVKVVNGDYSYRAMPGHITERPLTNVANNRPMDALGKLLAVDSTINPFVDDTTNFVVLNVKNSFLSMDMINKYLSATHHFIATGSDPDNHHAFNLVIPVNSVIKQSEYKYVALSIANQLMLKVAPEHCEHDMLYYGHQGASMLTATESAHLFDISGIIGNLASGADVPLLSAKPDKRPNVNVINKYLQDEIIQHKQLLIDMLDASSNPLLLFASIVYDMRVHWVSDEQILELIDSVNSSLIKSIDEETKQVYLIEPFASL